MTGDASASDDRETAAGDERTPNGEDDEPTLAGGERTGDGADAASEHVEQTPGDVSEEFLVEVVKRAPLFDLLREGPCEMNEMVDRLDMSRSTIHRATQSLTEKDLLRNRDGRCELTGLGRTVAEQVADFRAQVAGATKLRSFLNTADPEETDVPVARFADARVYHPKPRQPHYAIKRIIELIEDADSVQMFSSIISPFYVDVAYREMLEGTEIEVVFDPEVVDIVATEYTEKAHKAAQTGKFDVFVHENVPFELFVFDDCVGMAAHDRSGIARVFVESDASAAVAWAEDVYATYRERATHLDVDAL